MKIQESKKKAGNIITKCGCVIASAVFLLGMTSCAPSNEEKVTATQTPADSLIVSAAPTKTAIPIPTPVPAVMPEPTPSYTFIGQAYCDAKDSVNIRAEANAESEIIGMFPAGGAADVIEYSDKWARLVYCGVEGYVSREYILEIKNVEVTVPVGDWASIVVNPSHYIPDDYKVTVADFKNGQVNERILNVCERMFADAKADGVDLKLVDAYRSYGRQNYLYQKKVNDYINKGYSRSKAEKEAATITARPGTSEHQTGLALDIVTPLYTKMNKGFANTAAFRWLNDHAYNYGFTLRYPVDKKAITKIIYEPWHWRFVGVKVAAQMKVSGECLEEYFDVMD